jgi:hypothetical protein
MCLTTPAAPAKSRMTKPSVYGKQSVQFKSAHENRWHDRQMEHTQVRPKERNYMDLRVEMIRSSH